MINSRPALVSPIRSPVAGRTSMSATVSDAARPWMVMMPPHLMYGEEGDGRIPPNATVVYEVRLDSVIYIEAPPVDPPK